MTMQPTFAEVMSEAFMGMIRREARRDRDAARSAETERLGSSLRTGKPGHRPTLANTGQGDGSHDA